MTGQELRDYLKENGYELKLIAEEIGISPQTLNSRLNAKSVKTSTIEEIEKVINKKIYSSNASMVNPPKSSSELFLETKAGTKYYEISDGRYKMRVPLVPMNAHARYANEFYNQEADREEWEERDFEVDKIGHGKYVAFEVKGDSMDDGSRKSFGHGDIVLARDLHFSHWKDGLRYNKYPYWVIVTEGSVLIKQIVDQDAETGDIRCHSLNPSPEYCDFTINLNEVRQLFNVIQIKHQDTFI